MTSIRRLLWWLAFIVVCGALLVSGTDQLRQFASAHPNLPAHLLLAALLAIPTSIVTLAVGFALEALLVGWSRSSLRMLGGAPASVRLDALCMAIVLLPTRALTYVLSVGLLVIVDLRVLQPTNISLMRLIPVWGIQIGCWVLLQSFLSYWVHRLEHTLPALWALHKFHHSADRMSILTAVRQTQLVVGLEQIVLLFFLALLGAPTVAKPAAGSPLFAAVIAYFLYRNFVRVNQYLVHSNLTADYGWIGRWLLVSPRMHRLHHAACAQYHDKNFTFDLVIWDRLFGTYASCDSAAVAAIPLGLEDNPFNSAPGIRGVLRDYFVTPYVAFWQALRTGAAAWRPVRLGLAESADEAPRATAG